MWTEITSAACSIHRAEEEAASGRPPPRAALGAAAAVRPSLAITIRDPWETEGWRKTNRTLRRWWTECRRRSTGGPSHIRRTLIQKNTHNTFHTHHCRGSVSFFFDYYKSSHQHERADGGAVFDQRWPGLFLPFGFFSEGKANLYTEDLNILKYSKPFFSPLSLKFSSQEIRNKLNKPRKSMVRREEFLFLLPPGIVFFFFFYTNTELWKQRKESEFLDVEEFQQSEKSLHRKTSESNKKKKAELKSIVHRRQKHFCIIQEKNKNDYILGIVWPVRKCLQRALYDFCCYLNVWGVRRTELHQGISSILKSPGACF